MENGPIEIQGKSNKKAYLKRKPRAENEKERKESLPILQSRKGMEKERKKKNVKPILQSRKRINKE